MERGVFLAVVVKAAVGDPSKRQGKIRWQRGEQG
jgi:hypothetical protein